MTEPMELSDAMKLTSRVSGATAFDDTECAALWDQLSKVPRRGRVVEIGSQYGRTSSLILQAARCRDLIPAFIDPWDGNTETMLSWMKMAHSLEVPLSVHMMRTEQARDRVVWSAIDLLLIDGDHSEAGVRIDLQCMAPFVRVGGCLCAHDYGRDSLPEVYATINNFMAANPVWVPEGVHGTLGMWRRQ